MANDLPIDLVTQSDAATLVGVTRQVIRERITAGRITGYEDALGRVMVSLSEVQAYKPRLAGRKKKKVTDGKNNI